MQRLKTKENQNELSLNDNKSESSTLTITSPDNLKLKKYRSAYIIFCSEIRKKLKLENYEDFNLEELDRDLRNFFEENKGKKISNNELTIKIAEFWKNCSSKEKEYFLKKEKEEKENFDEKKQKLNVNYKYSKCGKKI